MYKLKIALDIGHLYKDSQPLDRGAFYKGMYESDIVRNYMQKTYNLLEGDDRFEVYISDPYTKILVGDYWKRREWVNKNFTEKDIYIQGHLNAGRGNYGMLLAVNDLLSITLREIGYGAEIVKALQRKLKIPFKDRMDTIEKSTGIYYLKPDERGYSILTRFKCPAFILEPCFIDNDKHFDRLVNRDWTDKIAEGLTEAFKIIYNVYIKKEKGGENA
jgi:N-acetylmuramoyl-L-alanine amidase